MKTIHYARFSPRPGAADCDSSLVQLADLRQWAVENRHVVCGEFRDDATSGSDSLEDRPGLVDALYASKRGMLFVVRSLDRLFRDTQKSLMFRTHLKSRGVRLVSVREPGACLETPESELQATIFMAVAEYQRQLIRATTKAKMRQAQREGRRMSKIPPYGYRAEGKLLVPIPEQQETIGRILELHGKGYGRRKICRRLTEEDCPSPSSSGWYPSLIQRILRREEHRIKS